MRWNPPEFGQVSPAEFIPMAERLGYINLLGENIIRIAGRQCKKWADAGLDLRMNINLSVGQIIEPDFLDKIDTLFDETGAPPEKICFEVTESLAIHDERAFEAYNRQGREDSTGRFRNGIFFA